MTVVQDELTQLEVALRVLAHETQASSSLPLLDDSRG
jgi:hypothetical protein